MKMHLDPTSLTIGDIMKKLKKEDEARFREVMEDLSYEGKDPNWLNQGIMDQLNQIKGFEASQKDDTQSLHKIRDKLMKDKA
jgi:dihydroxyacetone kinase DhaKLM complex PTS-EIIA-like component DhaM